MYAILLVSPHLLAYSALFDILHFLWPDLISSWFMDFKFHLKQNLTNRKKYTNNRLLSGLVCWSQDAVYFISLTRHHCAHLSGWLIFCRYHHRYLLPMMMLMMMMVISDQLKYLIQTHTHIKRASDNFAFILATVSRVSI